MNFTGIRTTAVLLTCSLALAACHSRGGPAPSASGPAQPQARPVSFDAPTTPQAAEKAAPPGDRTPQTLDALAVRGRRVLAAGYDNSFNVGRPMFLTSDDGGATWTRRGLDAASVARSGTDERPADVVSGPRGFVAAGESDSGPVLWSSTDGTSWSRPVVDRKVFRASDHVAALTTTPKGFLLVGTGDTSYGGNPNHVVLWRSRDGVTWQRTSGPALGVEPEAAGSVDVDDVVAHGNSVVIVGDLSTPGGSEQTDRIHYWYSTDAGRSFLRSEVRGRIATDYRVYNRTAAFLGGRFYALVQGSGADKSAAASWDGVVLEGGATGKAWREVAEPAALGTAAQEQPSTLNRIGADWIVTSQRWSDTEDAIVSAGPRFDQLADRTDATQQGAADQYVNAALPVGADLLMAGSTTRSGTTEAAVWRYHRGKVVPVRLPKEAAEGRPSASVGTLVSAGKDLLAVGAVSEAPAAWQLVAGGWQATVLPGRGRAVDLWVDGAIATPDGRAVAFGGKQLSIGQRAALWLRDAAGHWSQLDSPRFGVQARSPFGGPSPSALAVSRHGWLLSGNREDGDGHQDAWAVFSHDGRTWSDGRGGRQLPADPKSRLWRTPWTNLRAPDGGSASMQAAVPLGNGFVTAGYTSDGSTYWPTAWLSPDGSNWPRVVRLPVPKGVRTTTVHLLQKVGTILVAVGETARFDGDTEGGWICWTSTDGGRTWRAGASHAGIVALGAVGPSTGPDAAAWFSADGRSWRPVPVPGDRAKGPGDQVLVTGVVHDGKLLVVGKDVPPAGGGYYTLDLDVPR